MHVKNNSQGMYAVYFFIFRLWIGYIHHTMLVAMVS